MAESRQTADRQQLTYGPRVGYHHCNRREGKEEKREINKRNTEKRKREREKRERRKEKAKGEKCK
jgi:hypothetical protein